MSPRSAAQRQRPDDAPNHPPTRFQEVPIDQVVASPQNPRHRGIGKADDQLDDLVASIKHDGILEPLVVRETHTHGDGILFEIVAGYRRRRAAGLAGLTMVPVTIREVSDQKMLELALSENLHRKEMHWLDEAAALAKLQEFDPLLKDLAVLGSHVGRSATYVRDRLKLLKLHPVVVEAIDAGALTFKHAELIARLTPDLHLTALEECYAQLLTIGSHQFVPRSKAIAEKQWDVLAKALVGTRELEKFVTTRAKADVRAPEVQEKLREIVQSDVLQSVRGDMIDGESTEGDVERIVQEELEDATTNLLQLSTKGGYEFTKGAARQARVVHKDDWKVGKPGSCKYLRRGIIVHPADAEQRIVDNVCASKACSKHHPKRPSPSYSNQVETPQAREKREANEKRQQELWAAVVEAALPLLAALAAKQKFGAAMVKQVVAAHDLAETLERFKLTLNNKSAAQVLLLSQVRTRWADDFRRDCKSLGFNLAAVEKKVKAEIDKTDSKPSGGVTHRLHAGKRTRKKAKA